MKLINKIRKRRKRGKNLSKKKTLEEIQHTLNSYSNRKYSLENCLATAGSLSTDLVLSHCPENKIPDNVHDKISILFTIYYIMLHMDNYTGQHLISRDYIYKQAEEMCEEILKEAVQNNKMKSLSLHIAHLNAKEPLWHMVNTDYDNGKEGCLHYLAGSIHTLLKSSDKTLPLTKNSIAVIIGKVHADKYFELYDSNLY